MTYPAAALMILGTAFLLVAALGVIRLRDPLQRMHSATKAGTLGVALLLIGVLLHDRSGADSVGWLTILFLLLTLPIGAQLLARATYVSGTALDGIDDDPLAGELDRAQTPIDV
ncbi:MAG: monovalent cation/H(+) antiporter subunit G [Sphingomonadales bacterium]|nr:monovalent cation/H(+) antiporter subunit G [Sphingomonadales bacterium]